MSTGKNKSNTVNDKGASRSDDGLSKVKSLFGSGFSDSAVKNSEKDSSMVSSGTVIDEKTEIDGKLKLASGSIIKGTVRGEVFSEGTLLIDKTAHVFASITAKALKVMGQVEGNIQADELFLIAPAVISGDISSAKLRIEEGVVFEGTCSMNSKAAGSCSGSSKK